MRIKGHCKDGLAQGKWEYFDEMGNLIETVDNPDDEDDFRSMYTDEEWQAKQEFEKELVEALRKK